MTMGGTSQVGGDTAYLKLVTTAVSVTTASTEILTAQAGRGKIVLVNTSTNVDVFISSSSSVSTASGFLLLPRVHTEWPYAGDLYGIVQTTTTIVSVGSLEEA